MLTAQTLRGTWGTLLMPVNADDTIGFSRLSAEIDYLLAAGVDGVYSNGTAGEIHNQTEEEFVRIQEMLAQKCHRAAMPFQIGASHPFPIISLQRIQRTAFLQPDAFQVIMPDWVVVNRREQVIFLSKLADAAMGIPLVLYNPPHAKVILSPADFGFLKKEIPQLIGIKVAGGDAAWYEQMRSSVSGISVFIPGHFLATGVQNKVAAGAYSNVACLNPEASMVWWHLMQTNLQEALEVEAGILKFFRECIVPFKEAGYSNPALDKFLAAIGGWADIGTRLRWPYQWIPEAEVMPARKKAKKYLPGWFHFDHW